MRSSASTKVKIRREKLIEKLRESRTEQEANYNKLQAKFDTNHPKSAEKVANALRKLADQLEKDNELMYENVAVRKYAGTATATVELGKIEVPEKPYKTDTDNLDRMIRVLESSCEDFIMVSIGDDYSRYL